MSKRSKRQRNSSFVMMGRPMLLKCQEWKELKPASKIFYLYLKAKYNGSNNGKIRLHYSELKGVAGLSSSSTIANAIRELEEGGWIKRTKRGGLMRYFNEFELTGRHDGLLSS